MSEIIIRNTIISVLLEVNDVRKDWPELRNNSQRYRLLKKLELEEAQDTQLTEYIALCSDKLAYERRLLEEQEKEEARQRDELEYLANLDKPNISPEKLKFAAGERGDEIPSKEEVERRRRQTDLFFDN